MAIDALQKQVLATISKTRSGVSFVAGGSLLNRHAPRLSHDQDIFLSEDADAVAIAEADIRALSAAGFEVRATKKFEGFVEATVGNATMGATRLQWTKAGSWAFFAPVADVEYGFRLHMADLCVDKALAAGGRREVRDYVDLYLIHSFVMPLWVAVWAAPGKDEKWTPFSLLERIARQNAFRQTDIDGEIASLQALSAAEIGRTLSGAIAEAREIFSKLDARSAGKLAIYPDGACLTQANADAHDLVLSDLRWIEAKKGGGMPSSPDMDRGLVLGLIAEFGPDASKLTGADGGSL